MFHLNGNGDVTDVGYDACSCAAILISFCVRFIRVYVGHKYLDIKA